MRVCAYEDCDRTDIEARGWCSKHYLRWKRHGDPSITLIRQDSGTVVERFWAKVDKTETCWLWTAATSEYNGYGYFKAGKSVLAHRFAYELVHGTIPDDQEIDHRCGVRLCVNPAHLRAVTRKQNVEHITVLGSNNTSGVHGVFWNRRNQNWRVRIMHNRKAYEVGSFSDLADAEAAAIAKRNELFTHNDRDRVGVSA